MPRRSIIVVVAFALVCPALAFAQASLTGVVRDTSGAVLPGVTVEAASPALIEKVRSAITDGGGQYRIVELQPGTYTVTFTLAGFSTILIFTAVFYWIFIWFRDHEPPHFHAVYGEFEAALRIDTLEVVAGSLPRRTHALVLEWASLHRTELADDWERARKGEPLAPIQPLDP